MPRILIINRQKKIRLNLNKLSRQAEEVLNCLGEEKAELSLSLVSSKTIAQLHKKYLSACRVTDVLSFPMRKGEDKNLNPHLLGDVVISVEQALIQAREWRESPEKEITRLLIHGILHLVGFQDSRKAERMKMISQQEKILSLVYETA